MAEQKDLVFPVKRGTELPESPRSDPQRLQQVLKNLLANAFKFTEKGSITLKVDLAPSRRSFQSEILQQARKVIAFSVVDTGIGIPKGKQKIIFEAFQQADGTTSRKYGGTGLGLSISREIARLLGGEIHVESEPGVGSTFTLYLPDRYVRASAAGRRVPSAAGAGRRARDSAAVEAGASRLQPGDEGPRGRRLAGAHRGGPAGGQPAHRGRPRPSREGDRVVLIIEDDLKFARIMLNLAREKGSRRWSPLAATPDWRWPTSCSPTRSPWTSSCPIVDGWSVLDRLKRNPARGTFLFTSSPSSSSKRGGAMGAFAYLEKPVSKERLEGAFQHISHFLDRQVKLLLLVEDDAGEAQGISSSLGKAATSRSPRWPTPRKRSRRCARQQYDCMVVDLDPAGHDGHQADRAGPGAMRPSPTCPSSSTPARS